LARTLVDIATTADNDVAIVDALEKQFLLEKGEPEMAASSPFMRLKQRDEPGGRNACRAFRKPAPRFSHSLVITLID
jgi:hypothetical protein